MTSRSRKGPKRKPPIEKQIDPSLVEIAQMLDEHRLESNATGWFALPWRDGYNAARLALDVWDDESITKSVVIPARAWDIKAFIKRGAEREYHPSEYWEIDEFLHQPIDFFSMPYLRAALRCLQVKLAKSDGGGDVYNSILANAISEVVVEDQVLYWRCRDAIGHVGLPHEIEKARRLFAIAWRRGMVHAAYAIGDAFRYGRKG